MPLPRNGPVRSEAARQAVLRATSELVNEVGYDQLTIEGIAVRAGVAKQTIYRWWSSRSAVVAEALVEGLLLSDHLVVPHTGSITADLHSWLEGLAGLLEDPQRAGVMTSIITAATQNAEIASHLRDVLAPTESLIERLSAAIGEAPNLRPDTPIETLADMIVGAVLVRVMSRHPLDQSAIDDLVAAVTGTK
jgi:AcrR family transcriptional regulator